ncbi:MAG: hypothetical protein IPI38_12380 [Gemmatimonadetes bacterium]|nr:hypothetical protein [Gemmatimonadota bacterium]MBP9199914.1 hypothetical protein [Gemmatimonadales bacterium]MBK6779561.1 hypothetical protein [Gemmatimonadota bacterium]MBK7350282.1 hypothetical protein [Gemmatimonadota bacterium]MBK7716199.1 hypothetical protein [Gemmatimonadota bacterium]
MKRATWLLPLLLLGAGCAYYNGMYNAKRLAGRARKAEREGRTFDASSLWGQVAVKAESVLVRHPGSKWDDEARLLQGTAQARLKDCAGALPLLEQVMVRAENREFREQAAMLVGGCRVTLGDPVGATAAYARLTDSPDPERRNLALYAHGRALRIAGDFVPALAELSASADPRAPGERMVALAGVGRVPDALGLADSLRDAADSAAPWDSLMAVLARQHPAVADSLLETLAAAPGLPPQLRAALLLQDGVRRAPADTAGADRRFREAMTLAGRSPLEGEARYHRVRVRVARAETVPDLLALLDELEGGDDVPGPYGPRLSVLGTQVRRVAIAADSAPAGTPRGDLRLFAAGEMARDSVGATAFSRNQFARIAQEWPESPFAPKAIMALIDLQPEARDSLVRVLEDRYGTSPYVRLAAAGDDPGVAALEDSLRRFIAAFRPEGVRRPTGRPGQPARPTTSPREPVNR